MRDSLILGLQLGFGICTVLTLIMIHSMPSPKDTNLIAAGLGFAALTFAVSVCVHLLGSPNRGVWGIGIATIVFIYIFTFPWVVA
jgi:hypothetical protein